MQIVIYMKSQNFFPGKNKKNISLCHLLKILPRVLSDNSILTLKTSSKIVADDSVNFFRTFCLFFCLFVFSDKLFHISCELSD